MLFKVTLALCLLGLADALHSATLRGTRTEAYKPEGLEPYANGTTRIQTMKAQQGNQSYSVKEAAVALWTTQAGMKLHTAMNEAIDIDKMVKDQEFEALLNFNAWKKKVDDMKPVVDAARNTFRASRKTIRANFKACKKKSRFHGKKFRSKSECKPFKEFFLGVQTSRGEGLIEGAANSAGRRRRKKKEKKAARKKKKAEKKAARKEKKAEKKAAKKEKKAEKKAARQEKKAEKKAARQEKKAAKCAQRPICDLRQAKRRAIAQAKKDFKKIRSTFRDFKKQRNKAFFQLTVLPKIIILLKPALLNAMTEIDIVGSGTEDMLTSCAQLTGYTSDCVPLSDISTEDLMRNYISIKLEQLLSWRLTKDVFAPIKKKLWATVKPTKDSIKTSITTAVANIPFVGGGLAAVVGFVLERLYEALTKNINDRIGDVQSLLQDTIITSVVNAIFDTGLFTTANLQSHSQDLDLGFYMKSTSDTVSQTTVMATQNQFRADASEAAFQAEQDADGAEKEIENSAWEVEEEDRKDEQEDQGVYDEEDQADIEDDDE